MQDKFSLVNRDFSFWERELLFRMHDFIIIGAGLVGLSTALSIRGKYPAASILVVERASIPYGASTRNAGFACFGSVSEIIDDLKTMSSAEVEELINLRWIGLDLLKSRIGDDHLEYKSFGGYELFRTDEDVRYNDCTEHIEELNSLVNRSIGLENCYQTVRNNFGFRCHTDLIFNQYEGQLQPGMMMSRLKNLVSSKNIHILNGIDVNSFETVQDNVEVLCNESQKLSCNKLIITTNAFAPQLIDDELDCKPARNQVLITKPIKNLKIKGCFHYDRGYVYFRNYHDRILIGGGRNIAIEEETTAEFALTTKIQTYLRHLLDEVILTEYDYEEDHWWSGIIATGSKKKPIVKKIDENVYAGIRLSGMGVALGSIIGKQLAELV